MAVALKCDICNKYYDLYEDGRHVVSLSALNISNARVTKNTSADVCPDCKEAITKLIAERSKMDFDEWSEKTGGNPLSKEHKK